MFWRRHPQNIRQVVLMLWMIYPYMCVCVCVFLRHGQQASVLGGLKAAPHSQRGPERSSPQNTHVVCREPGTSLRSGCFWGMCVCVCVCARMCMCMCVCVCVCVWERCFIDESQPLMLSHYTIDYRDLGQLVHDITQPPTTHHIFISLISLSGACSPDWEFWM